MRFFFSSLTLAATAASVYMAGLVYFKDRRAAINRLFAAICVSIAWWAFALFEARIAYLKTSAEFWFAMTVWPLAPALFFNFALLYSGKARLRGYKLVYPVLYASALVIAIVNAGTGLISSEPVLEPWGWSSSPTGSSFSWLAPVYIGLLALAALFLVYRKFDRQQEPMLRRQAGIMLIGFSFPVIIGIIFDVTFPLLGINFPEMTVIAFGTGGVGFIGFAIWRYELFREQPVALAEDVTATPDALLILNDQGSITAANDSATEMLGRSEDEIRRGGFGEIFAEDASLWRFMLAESGEEMPTLRTRLRKKDGSFIEAVISAKKTVSAAGERETACIISDMSSRLTLANALKKSEQRYRRLLDASPDAIAVGDLKTTITMANQQAAIFYGADSPDELIGKNFLKILAPGQRMKAVNRIRKTIREGITKSQEYTFVKKDGSLFPGDVSAALLRNAAGRPEGFIASVRDLTERKRAEREIRERTEDLLLINTVDQAANRGEDINDLFKLLLDGIRTGFHSTAAALYLPADNGRSLTLAGDPISPNKRKKIETLLRRPISDFTTIPLAPGSLHLQLLEKGQPSLINDVDIISGLVSEFAPAAWKRFVPAVMKIMGVRSSICVPFVTGGEPLGMIMISRRELYCGRDLERISSIAEQITTVLKRYEAEAQIARQRAGLETRNSELTALYSVSSAIGATMDRDELLERALGAIDETGIAGLERRSLIFIRENGRLRLASAGRVSGSFMAKHKDLRTGQCLCGQAAQSGELLISRDSATDPRHTISDPGAAAHGHIVVPLKIRDKVTGVLCLYSPAGFQPQERQLSLLQAIASQLAIALDHSKLYEETKELSLHDPLTGLGNRRMLEFKLEENFILAGRTSRPFSLIMIDLDFFKRFNDAYGHLAGDAVLKEIAALVMKEIRGMDFACRFGGEEFLVVLAETERERAARVAERIRARVAAKEFTLNQGRSPAHITISLGVAEHKQDAQRPEELIARADAALYRAKQNGRDRVEC